MCEPALSHQVFQASGVAAPTPGAMPPRRFGPFPGPSLRDALLAEDKKQAARAGTVRRGSQVLLMGLVRLWAPKPPRPTTSMTPATTSGTFDADAGIVSSGIKDSSSTRPLNTSMSPMSSLSTSKTPCSFVFSGTSPSSFATPAPAFSFTSSSSSSSSVVVYPPTSSQLAASSSKPVASQSAAVKGNEKGIQ